MSRLSAGTDSNRPIFMASPQTTAIGGARRVSYVRERIVRVGDGQWSVACARSDVDCWRPTTGDEAITDPSVQPPTIVLPGMPCTPLDATASTREFPVRHFTACAGPLVADSLRVMSRLTLKPHMKVQR